MNILDQPCWDTHLLRAGKTRFINCISFVWHRRCNEDFQRMNRLQLLWCLRDSGLGELFVSLATTVSLPSAAQTTLQLPAFLCRRGHLALGGFLSLRVSVLFLEALFPSSPSELSSVSTRFRRFRSTMSLSDFLAGDHQFFLVSIASTMDTEVLPDLNEFQESLSNSSSYDQAGTNTRGNLVTGAEEAFSASFMQPPPRQVNDVFVDNLPSEDGWWTPPLHGDVEILSGEDVHNVEAQIVTILEAQDEPLCPEQARHDNRKSVDGSRSELLFPVSESKIPALFHFNRNQGSIVCGSREDLERFLLGIPFKKRLSELGKDLAAGVVEESKGEGLRVNDVAAGAVDDRNRWISETLNANDNAARAVEDHNLKEAVTQYYACLILLERVEVHIPDNALTWVVLWVCIPVLRLLLRFKEYYQCMVIFDLLFRHLDRELCSVISPRNKAKGKAGEDDEHEAFICLYYSVVWYRRLVLFDWSENEADERMAMYVRSKALTKFYVPKDRFVGFLQLQRLVNYWGVRSSGREGDMRIAFCFNLKFLIQHLYFDQWRRAANWSLKKWRYICDETHEQKAQWSLKFRDLFDLYLGGLLLEAMCTLRELEMIQENLPPAEAGKLVLWRARYELNFTGQPTEAGRRLQHLRRKLEDDENKHPEAVKLLNVVKVCLSERFLIRATEAARMGESTPFKVQKADWPLSKTGDLELLEEIELALSVDEHQEDMPFRLAGKLYQGFLYIRHAIFLYNLEVPASVAEMEASRERCYKGKKCFEDILHCISTNNFVDPWYAPGYKQYVKIRALQGLGDICSKLVFFKPRHVEYSIKDLQIKQHDYQHRIYEEKWYGEAIKNYKECLSLAEEGIGIFPKVVCNTTILGPVNNNLGDVYYFKARELEGRYRKFLELVGWFCAGYADLDEQYRIEVSIGLRELGGRYACDRDDIRHYHEYFLHLGLMGLEIRHLLKTSSDSDEKFEQVIFRGSICRLWYLGEVEMTVVDLGTVLEFCRMRLLDDVQKEVENCYYHSKRCLQLINEDQPRSYVETWSEFSKTDELASLFIVEDDKSFFTALQGVIHTKQQIRTYRQRLFIFGMGRRNFSLNNNCTISPAQEALLWAERSRSRALMHQLCDGVVDQSAKKIIHLDCTDEEAWEILREVQTSCGKESVFVEYQLDRKGFQETTTWMIYVIRKGKVHMLSETSKIPDKLLEDLHLELSKGKSGQEVKKGLEQLYDFFIKPISNLLRDMEPERKLIFAIDEFLYNVPFPILLNSETGKYLFENHTISFTPALRVLSHCEKQRLSLVASLQSPKILKPSVALGDPAYPLYRESRLVHTFREVMNISYLFKQNSVETLLGKKATVDQLFNLVRLSANEVQGFVHVAAHGFVDKSHKSGALQLAYANDFSVKSTENEDHADANQRSGMLQLAHANDQQHLLIQRNEEEKFDELVIEDTINNEDWTVEAESIRGQSRPESKRLKEARAKDNSCLTSEKIRKCGFEWRSHMVVLSGCNSAKGYMLRSEGVIGLPRAFLLVGVPCIVASQWSLEDESSAKLIGEFYMEMSKGRDVPSALRIAMLRRMELCPDEAYKWGGYLVWGSPNVTLPEKMLFGLTVPRSLPEV